MTTNNRKQIGVLLPIDLEYGRRILEGACAAARRHPEVEIHLLDMGAVSGSFPNGLVLQGLLTFTPTRELKTVTPLAPAVVSTSNRDEPGGTDFVVSDDIAVGRMAATYLIRRGYRDLVFAGRSGHQYSKERLIGFRTRAEEMGAGVRPIDLMMEGGDSEVRRELEHLKPRTGVFAANDIVARMIMQFTEDPEDQIPLRFALLGVDDDPVQRFLCPVPLSSVVLNGFEVGRVAMERLLARIETPELPPEVIRIAPVRVETRESTDLFAMEDDLAAKIIETMDENLSELSDIADLVERLQMPRRTLESRFRKATGRTLAKEMANLRIERARDLLRNEDGTMEEIAQAVGLPESRMLWLLFKRHTGETPSGYRKRLSQET